MKNRGEIITWLQNLIITSAKIGTAKDYEILGRAVIGCDNITINEDGSITNAYGILNRHKSEAAYRASRLIDNAIEDFKQGMGETL